MDANIGYNLSWVVWSRQEAAYPSKKSAIIKTLTVQKSCKTHTYSSIPLKTKGNRE